ncbi:hypothetical protein Tco_0118801, partial [Tanacetum coccineum]
QALQKDTQLPQTSVPILNVADEAVFKERGDRVVKATTTAASLDAAQASGDRLRCQESMGVPLLRLGLRENLNIPMIHLSQELTHPGSDEERIEHQELTENIPPTPHDSPLSGGYTSGSDEGRPDLNELMDICENL